LRTKLETASPAISSGVGGLGDSTVTSGSAGAAPVSASALMAGLARINTANKLTSGRMRNAG
jgi:hypothetical protein